MPKATLRMSAFAFKKKKCQIENIQGLSPLIFVTDSIVQYLCLCNGIYVKTTQHFINFTTTIVHVHWQIKCQDKSVSVNDFCNHLKQGHGEEMVLVS